MKKFILELIKSTPVEHQPFFNLLLNGTMDKEQFKKSQISLIDAVEFFPRPMFVILSKLSTYKERLPIIENILDEHGNGEIDKAHGNTFRQYLVPLGATKKEINNRNLNKAVLEFNNALIKCATNNPTERGLAMMGMIEKRYSKISAIIVKEILKKKWVSKDLLYHYSLHEELDVEHAEGFFNIIKDGWEDMNSRKEIQKGLTLGNSMILNLYNGIL